MTEKISMNVNETLELDYLVEQMTDDTIDIKSEPNNVSTSINYIRKHAGVFDPPDTGTYKLDINGQNVEIQVTDIPDSAIYRWKLDDVGSGTATDSIGNTDGNVIGVSSVSGTYQDGSGADGDGSDDNIQTSTLGSFGSNMDTDFAVAFTIEYTGPDGEVFAVDNTGSSGDMRMMVQAGGPFNNATTGHPSLYVKNTNGNEFIAEADSAVDDGSKYRVVVNKTGNAATDVDFYINTSVSGSQIRDNGFNSGSVEDFTHDVTIFARNSSGSLGSYLDATLDDLIVYGNSLSTSEVQTDYDAQPWT
jgi:hypothetical protein